MKNRNIYILLESESVYINIRVYDVTDDNQGVDLSQKTVVVLVVLTVLISVFGTFAVLLESNNIQTEIGVKTTGSSEAQVSLNVINPNEKPELPSATGQVSLEIIPPKTYR